MNPDLAGIPLHILLQYQLMGKEIYCIHIVGGSYKNLKGLNLYQSIVLKTAREALDNGLTQPTSALSHCVAQASAELNKKENENINLFATRNCKQETNHYLKQ